MLFKTQAFLFVLGYELKIFDALRIYKFPADFISSPQCMMESLNKKICNSLLLVAYELSTKHINYTFFEETVLLAVSGETFMAGKSSNSLIVIADDSLKTWVHYMQFALYPTDKFSWFNNFYGISQLFPNWLPKDYKLNGTAQTIYIFYSTDDALVPYQGIEVLGKRLSHSKLIKLPGYGHTDFVFLERATAEIYVPMTQRVSNPGIA